MEHIMDTLQFVNKGKLINSLEKFYIYSETVISNQMKEESTTESNKVYDVVRQMRTVDVDCDYVHVVRYIHCHSHIQSQSSHSHTPTRRR
jgi:hypothetical protein